MTITDIAPIITRRIGRAESWTLKTYLDDGGYSSLRKAVTSMTPDEVHAEVFAAGILGRGGAGFAAGLKWKTTMDLPQPHYLVINGDESEPCTFKDHMLIEADPHQLVEGAIIAAYATGCSLGFIYVRGEFALGMERVQQAVNEAYEIGALGPSVFGSGFALDLVVHPGAGAYICGEETALLESLEGKRGFPRISRKIPPLVIPATAGVYRKPTVVNNVETVSNLPWIVENGGAAFAALGGGRSTGTRLFSLSGHVKRPGNYELEWHKPTFRELIYDVGGGIRDDNELKAFIPGGVSSAWFGPQHLEVQVGQDEVAGADGVMPGGGGSMLGSGSVIVLDHRTCVVRIAWRIARFFERESCGQCTPCREGTGWLSKVMYRIESGTGRREDIDLLFDVSDNLAPGLAWPYPFTTICVLGPSAAIPVVCGLSMFRDEFLAHIDQGGCPFD